MGESEVKIDVRCANTAGTAVAHGEFVDLLMDGCNAGQRLGRSLALPGRGVERTARLGLTVLDGVPFFQEF